MRHVLVYAVALLITFIAVNGNPPEKLQCKDENNMPVDWYVVYKLPKGADNSNPLIEEGVGYLFITDETVTEGWQLSNRSIASNNSILANTLAPLYIDEKDKENLWVLYNEVSPLITRKPVGQAKGVAMVNSDQGFWLIHSVPNFPLIPKRESTLHYPQKSYDAYSGQYVYPLNGMVSEQSFLCVSLGGDQFDTVGKQLMFNDVGVYARNIPRTLFTKYPLLVNASRNQRIDSWPYTNAALIKSLKSVKFTSFAKNSNWGNDLYDDFVAPQLQTGLCMQSWEKTGEAVPSNCTGKNINNVLKLPFCSHNVCYKSTLSNSQWAVDCSFQDGSQWVCIDDINRTASKRTRGGGALCFNKIEVWYSYLALIVSN